MNTLTKKITRPKGAVKKSAPKKKAGAVDPGKTAAIKAQSKELCKEAQKLIVRMTVDMPAGGLKTLRDCVEAVFILKEKVKELNATKRGIMSHVKGMGFLQRDFNDFLRYVELDPNDRMAKDTAMAIMKKQMELPISEYELDLIDSIQKQKDESRKIIMETTGGDTGKEVGSSTSEPTPEPEDDDEEELPAAAAPNVNRLIPRRLDMGRDDARPAA